MYHASWPIHYEYKPVMCYEGIPQIVDINGLSKYGNLGCYVFPGFRNGKQCQV